MTPLLRRSALRWSVSHPWQVGATVLGVALAVAVVVGIRLANSSAERAFLLSVEGVAGRATHEIVGGPAGLDQALYTELRRSELATARHMAPVIEARGLLETADGSPPRKRSVRLLGIDPLAETAVRELAGPLRLGGDGAGNSSLTEFLLQPGAVIVGSGLATELGLAIDDRPLFRGRGGEHRLQVVGLFQPDDPLQREGMADTVIADLATAQELLGRLGRLDRIDLRHEPAAAGSAAEIPVDAGARGSRDLAADPDLRALAAALPADARLRAKSARSRTLDQMTRAFRLNLEALGLLALLVGMFLVYNTATFSVVQRRPLLGRLRAMGVTKGEIFGLVLFEAAVLGLIGSAIGLALGLGLARGLVELVTRTINDLYFALEVRSVTLSPSALAQGLLLGVLGPVLAAAVPALEASQSSPQWVLRRSAIETRTRRAVPRLALVGLGVMALAGALLALPSRDLLLAFAGLFCFVVGFACLVPGAVMVGGHLSAPALGRSFGAIGRLAARGVEGTLSRTGVALAALVIAIATTLGVGIMVASFRATLVDWLDGTLQADIYLTATVSDARGTSRPLRSEWIETVRAVPGVETISTYRRVEVESEQGPTQLHALDMGERAFRSFQWLAGETRTLYPRWKTGEGVLISEPYAYRHGLRVGDSVELFTDRGPASFDILGVFYDYASDRGLVMIERATYDRWWDDAVVQSLGIFLAEPQGSAESGKASGRPLEEVLGELRTRLAEAELSIMANRELRRASLEIFDRTFRITHVLRLLAVGVAFLGILAALMALQLERARELGILRANGLVPSQVWALVTTQTGLSGLFAGLLALPLGWILAALLIHVINKRSFGWTLVMETPPALLLQTVLLSVAAALLAGLYPARRMARSSPALALREE